MLPLKRPIEKLDERTDLTDVLQEITLILFKNARVIVADYLD